MKGLSKREIASPYEVANIAMTSEFGSVNKQ